MVSRTTGAAAPDFVPITTDISLPAPVPRAAPVQVAPLIDIKLAGAVVRVVSGMDDDAAQLTAVLRAVRASARRS
jgi:hypothetical protein